MIVLLAMRKLGVTKDNLAQPFRAEGANQWFHTSAEDTVLGTDGDIWWVELESGMDPPQDGALEDITAGVQKAALPETSAAKLQRLREAKEVVESDSDLNDIFMLVRSDTPLLTRKFFLKSLPKARALVITQEQLWQIEGCVDNDPESANNRFTYVTATGKKRTVEGDYLDEPLVIFLEELGD